MPGRYFEEFSEGDVIEHRLSRTITEADNVLFCSITMNTQPLHLDEEWAKKTPFGKRVVNGLYTLSLSVGMSVPDLTEGTLVANLGYYEVEHTKPVFHGDTIRITSEVLSKRQSRSKPQQGVVEILHHVYNQHDDEVLTYKRRALVKLKNPPAA